ncbi:DUF501 domain-containing protein [Pseudohalioglobus lutimaris]|uniref:DUF501 domain-containing protein n=1 Tax=Pseudohalioglobus lutimaris TaxID=1737061 RepID=UPI001FB0332A|nr:DUF501 domain-containing protein [Pseudohalioglobus lutimaris]
MELNNVVSVEQRAAVAALLGREPRGLEAVPVLSAAREPMVIRVSSLVDDKPFPTLYWLVDSALNYRIDGAEAGGLIAILQARIDQDAALQAAMVEDHRLHIADRDGFMDEIQRKRIAELGFCEVFSKRGIGGIADFTRIRCLHTWYAAHMVRANTVGRLLDAHWASEAESTRA